jgi:hypothetical protein
MADDENQMSFDNWSEEQQAFMNSIAERENERTEERRLNSDDAYERRPSWKPDVADNGAGKVLKGVIVEGAFSPIKTRYNLFNIAIRLTLPEGEEAAVLDDNRNPTGETTRRVTFFMEMHPVANKDTLEPATWENGETKLRQEYKDYLNLLSDVMRQMNVEDEEDIFPFKCDFMRYKEHKTSVKTGNSYTLARLGLKYEQVSKDEVQFDLDSI